MAVDKSILIPMLSKEIGLVGLSPLPYKCRNRKILSSRTESTEEGLCEFSDDEQEPSSILEVSFKKQEMLDCLVSTCFKLVKQLKQFDTFEATSTNLHTQMKHDNSKLKIENRELNEDIIKKRNIIAAANEKYRQLDVKYSVLIGQLKESEAKLKLLSSQWNASERHLKSNLAKSDANCRKFHDLLCKKFQTVDVNYAVHNLETYSADPEFRTLWMDSRSLNPSQREIALKHVVCRFQEISESLRLENTSLKTLLVGLLDQLQDLTNLVTKRLNIASELVDKTQVNRALLLCSFDPDHIRTYTALLFRVLTEILLIKN